MCKNYHLMAFTINCQLSVSRFTDLLVQTYQKLTFKTLALITPDPSFSPPPPQVTNAAKPQTKIHGFVQNQGQNVVEKGQRTREKRLYASGALRNFCYQRLFIFIFLSKHLPLDGKSPREYS